MRIAVVVFTLLAGCAPQRYPGAPEAPSVLLQESDAARPIDLERGKRVTLRLEAHHDTGYRWTLAASGDGRLEQIGEPFYTAEKNAVGAGGAEYWQFRATGGGQAALHFEYRRSWEKDKAAAKVLDYTVNVLFPVPGQRLAH